MPTVSYKLENEDGDEETIELPAKWALCPDCKGDGSVLNPSMRTHAYTHEEFDRFSENEKKHYFKRGGMYDVQCPTCLGRTTVAEVDAGKLTPKQAEQWKAVQERAKDHARWEAEDRAIRRMESGGYE